VKLRGVVPVKGHWGSTAGIRKYVWIYKRTKSASAPPTRYVARYAGDDQYWRAYTSVRKVRVH